MGLLTPHDADCDMSVRQTGFYRYKQLLSFYGANWLKINLITVLGALPLTAGILFSLLSTSVLVLVPLSVLGGMLFSPFLSGLYDAILRGLRDDPDAWWDCYKKSWKQNWRESLLPGAIFGLLLGMYTFMAGLLWWSQVTPSRGTLALYLFSGLLFVIVLTLYWPQIVLFQQSPLNRLRNVLLFTAKYLWRVLGVALLQLAYWLVYILFAPWTLILIPFLGMWYILFVSQFLIYDQLNEELKIEEQFRTAEQKSNSMIE